MRITMMYVVKVGEYYVRQFSVETLDICIVLSKELMRTFEKDKAESLAKQLNGTVVEIADEVTNE